MRERAALAVIAAASWLGPVVAAPLLTQTPTPASGMCRTYSTDETRESKSAKGTDALHVTCKFDKSTKQQTCHTTHTGSSSYAYDQITQFASVADFVGEPTRVEFFPRAQSITVKFPGSISGQAYKYDGRGYLVSIATTSSAGTGGATTQTFTAWDQYGRPTAGRDETQAYVYGYDDDQRIFTQESNGAGGRIAAKYNADGNQISSVTALPGLTITTTITIKATEQICK